VAKKQEIQSLLFVFNKGRRLNFLKRKSVVKGLVKCAMCDSYHSLFACSAFKELLVEDRWTKVQQQWFCYNCLSSGPAANQCSSKGCCRRCNSTHHTLLHNDADSSRSITPTSNSPVTPTLAFVRRLTKKPSTPRIPITALALAFSTSHQNKCRMQLDTGAMLSLVP